MSARCQLATYAYAWTGDPEAAFCMRVCNGAVNRCVPMPPAKQRSCSVNEVAGFVSVPHGREQASHASVRDAAVRARPAEDKHG